MNSGESKNKSGYKLALLSASMLIGMGAMAANAAETKSDVVVVTGFKKSYADAVRAKKQSVEITDGISSDGLGRFPDLNVGEALQRIPGIQINREAEGRNATIGLRGMPGTYARVTLNGQAFADITSLQTTGGADSSPMGAFNSDIFSAFQIQKSPMANTQSGGLSGNIDMQIAPALSRKDGGFFKLSIEHNSLGSLSSPAYTIGYNKHISPDLAVFGTLAYKKENFRRDTLRYNGYSRLGLLNSGLTKQQYADLYGAYLDGTATTCSTDALCGITAILGTSGYTMPTNVGTLSKGGVWTLGLMRQYTRMNVGNLWTASGGVEWKPNDNTKLGLVAYSSKRDMPNTTQYFLLNEPYMLSATATSSSTPYSTVTGLTTPVVMNGPNKYAVIQRVRIQNFDAKSSTRAYSQEQEASGLVGTAEWKNEKWKLNATLAITGSAASSLETEIDVRTIGNTTAGGANSLVEIIDQGMGDVNKYYQSVTPTPQNIVMSLPFYGAFNSSTYATTAYQSGSWNWSPSSPTDLFTSDNRYLFHIGGTHQYASKAVNSLQLDAERQVAWGPITSIKGGVRIEENNFRKKGVRNMAYGINTAALTSDMLIKSPSVSDFMEGKANINQDWWVFDAQRVMNAIRPVTVFNGGALSAYGFNVFYADGGFVNNNFYISNQLDEAYLQANYDTSVLGHRIRGNFGARTETTEYEVTTLDRTASSFSYGGVGALKDFSWHTYTKKYSHLLPSAIFVADLADNMLLRGAYYETYVRPDPQTTSPIQRITTSANSLSTSTNVITDVTVTMASSRLKPYTAESFDLSWEWYNRPNGLISLAYFKKKLNNRVESISNLAITCPSDGGGWGYGALTWDGTRCTSATTTTGGVSTTYYVSASGLYNVEKPTYVNGLEFNIQQNLDFLPGFWKNFGGSYNYAFTTAKAKFAGGPAVPFAGISKYNMNTILYYETPKWGVRTVYNWRSRYFLDTNGTSSGTARYAADRGQLDLSASYNLTDKISLSLDAYNLTNTFRKEYQDDERMIRWIDYDGKTYTFTVKANF